MPLFKVIETISVDQIYALRVQRGKDQLLQYSLKSVLLMVTGGISLIIVILAVLLGSGVPLGQVVTHFLLYPDGPGSKGRPYIFAVLIALLTLFFTAWMSASLLAWVRRKGQSPLVVEDHRITFNGKAFVRNAVRHFERRKFGPCGALAIVLNDGTSFQMLDSGIYGAPVREISRADARATRSWISFQLALNLASIIIAILVLFFLLD